MKAENFFDLAGWEWADLFAGTTYVWEALKRLPDHLDLFFREGRARNFPLWRRILFWWFSHVTIRGNVAIGKNCQIFPGAYIGNYVIVGDNCIIGQNATIRDYTILSDGCRVGPSGEVAKSIFLPGARAAHKNFIGDSILGRSVNLAAGAETANWKITGGEISVQFGNKKIPTGLDHLGAVIGDDTSIGGNSVLDPGALVGKNCLMDALMTIPNGYIPNWSRIRNPNRQGLMIEPRKSRPPAKS